MQKQLEVTIPDEVWFGAKGVLEEAEEQAQFKKLESIGFWLERWTMSWTVEFICNIENDEHAAQQEKLVREMFNNDTTIEAKVVNQPKWRQIRDNPTAKDLLAQKRRITAAYRQCRK